MNFDTYDQSIPGLKVIQWKINEDERGFFSKLFSQNEFEEFGIDLSIKQVNFSHNSKKGTLRGMHYQDPQPDAKLITCINGSILDVALDIRKDSDTFLQWHSVVLDSRKSNSFLIPRGFAHGFVTLENDVKILYLHDEEYLPLNQYAINPFDPAINIEWKQEVISISDRDKECKFINDGFEGLVIE